MSDTPHTTFTIVGIGDDGPVGLGQEAREAIARAELLLGGQRQLAWYAGHPATKLTITKNLDDVTETIQREFWQTRTVVLASGDPMFFGIGSYLCTRCDPGSVRVIPHVSSVQLAFARLGTGWHDATVLSAHGRPLVQVLRPALDATKVAILTDGVNPPGVLARALLAAGMEECPVAVCEHLGGPDERIVRGTLSQLIGQTFAELNVLVLLRDAPARPPLALGLNDDDYAHARGHITKAEVRAVSISRLRLRRGGTSWDIGAGSGSVAIEAALLSAGRVYAVEKSREQCTFLHENIGRFHASGVHVIAGEAPSALDGLPTPDAIFIGGSGGRLTDVLTACGQRLSPGGRVVLNLATLDHLAAARAWFTHQPGWEQELTQVQVSRAQPIAGDNRLAALNPIWILAATRAVVGDGGSA